MTQRYIFINRTNKIVLLLFITIPLIFVGVMINNYYSYDLKDNIYPADLVIVKNGAMLNYNLDTGKSNEIEINKHDEDGYKSYVFEGLKYENNMFVVKNPTYLQLISDDFKTINKEELPKEINYSPYMNSIAFFNDSLYYVSNSHVNDKMLAVSCEYYNDQVECFDGVIDTYVKNYDNKLYALLDYDNEYGKNYALLRIRDDKQVSEFPLDLKTNCDYIYNFTIYEDHLYILFSNTINDNEKIYLAKLDMDLKMTDRIEVSNTQSYSDLYLYDDIIYLYGHSHSSIDVPYLTKYDTSNLQKIERINLSKSKVFYSNKQDFIDDKLFIYHGNSLGIYDIDDNKMLYNNLLSLPHDYKAPYDSGCVTIRLHEKDS